MAGEGAETARVGEGRLRARGSAEDDMLVDAEIKFSVQVQRNLFVRRLREDEGSPVDGLVTERGRGTKNEKENLAFNQRHRFSTQRVDDAHPVRTRGGKGRSRGGNLVGRERDSIDAFHREK